jgi:hypothetical protein
MEEKIMEYAIKTHGLKKYFGKNHAVDGIDLKIPKGSLYGVLGPYQNVVNYFIPNRWRGYCLRRRS